MEAVAGALAFDDVVWDGAKGCCRRIPEMEAIRKDDEVLALFHRPILAGESLYLKGPRFWYPSFSR